MKCLNIGCKNDLTPTDVSKMTFKNRYRFCRRCKQSKIQNLRYRCMLCGKIIETDYLAKAYCSLECSCRVRDIKLTLSGHWYTRKYGNAIHKIPRLRHICAIPRQKLEKVYESLV